MLKKDLQHNRLGRARLLSLLWVPQALAMPRALSTGLTGRKSISSGDWKSVLLYLCDVSTTKSNVSTISRRWRKHLLQVAVMTPETSLQFDLDEARKIVCFTVVGRVVSILRKSPY